MNYLYDDNYCTTNMLSFILKNDNLKNYVINFNKNLLYCYDKEIKDIHYAVLEEGLDSYSFSMCFHNCKKILIKENIKNTFIINMNYDIFFEKF
jgi:hypothetical protein